MYSELQILSQPERTSGVPWGDVVLPEAVGQADAQVFRQWIAGRLFKVSKVLGQSRLFCLATPKVFAPLSRSRDALARIVRWPVSLHQRTVDEQAMTGRFGSASAARAAAQLVFALVATSICRVKLFQQTASSPVPLQIPYFGGATEPA